MVLLYFALPSDVLVDANVPNKNPVSKIQKGKNYSRFGRKGIHINQGIMSFIRKNRSSDKLIKLSISNVIEKKPSIHSSHVKIFCRVGLFLQINANGTINGTVQYSNPYSKFSTVVCYLFVENICSNTNIDFILLYHDLFF